MFRRVCIVLFGIAAFAIGCDDEEPGPSGPPNPEYEPLTSPENLIVNLQASYIRRDIEQYAQLLAPEFRFQFQPIDQTEIGKEFWTHDEDSVGTRALLTTPEVAVIRISLLYSGKDSTIDKTPPADSVRIRIQTTDLQVEQTNEVAWVVVDQQDMFFRKGISANGENPAHWFMYEWDDLPSLASPRPLTPVLTTTWGTLKSKYGN